MAYDRKCSGRALVATVSTAAILAAWMTTRKRSGSEPDRGGKDAGEM